MHFSTHGCATLRPGLSCLGLSGHRLLLGLDRKRAMPRSVAYRMPRSVTVTSRSVRYGGEITGFIGPTRISFTEIYSAMKLIHSISLLFFLSGDLAFAQETPVLDAPVTAPAPTETLGDPFSTLTPLVEEEVTPTLPSPPALPEAAAPELLPARDEIVDAGGDAVVVEPGPDLPVVAAASGEDVATTGPSGGENPYDLVLKDGRVLKSYQIHSWNKTMLTIFHSTGAASIPAHVLPENVVKAYGMDTKLSAEQEKVNRTQRTTKAAADLQAFEERQALRKMPVATVEGLVISVNDEGVVLQIEDPEGIAGAGYQRIGGMIYDQNSKPVPKYRGQIFGAVWVTNHPLQGVVVDGDQLRFQARVSGRKQVGDKTYPSIRFEKTSR
jgi:hypothetical protein